MYFSAVKLVVHCTPFYMVMVYFAHLEYSTSYQCSFNKSGLHLRLPFSCNDQSFLGFGKLSNVHVDLPMMKASSGTALFLAQHEQPLE